MKISTFAILLVFLSLYISQIQCDDSYSHEKGLDYFFYAKASQCEKNDIQNWTCDSCKKHPEMTDVQAVKKGFLNAQSFVAYNPKDNLIVIAFNGTKEIRQWFADASFFRKSYKYCKGCKAHSGFMTYWNTIKSDTIKAYLKLREKYQSATLLVTGHSLGGATAHLAALDIEHMNHKVHELYCYGSPRVGNTKFAQYAHKKIPQLKQVIQYDDPVPHMPPRFLGYTRVPTEVWYYKKNDTTKWKMCKGKGVEEVRKCSDKFLIFKNFGTHTGYLGESSKCETNSTKMDLLEASYTLSPEIEEMLQLDYYYSSNSEDYEESETYLEESETDTEESEEGDEDYQQIYE